MSQPARPPVPRERPIAERDSLSGVRHTGSARIEARLAKGGGWVELLHVPACLFGVLVRARRLAYDRRFFRATHLDVPVISVGNLTSGGTGKTPLCAHLVHELERRGMKAGILARGYAADRAGRDGVLNDEGEVLRASCPNAPQVQDRDRVRGGRALCEQGVDVIVLDDGFQHRRLFRDLDIVVVDATRPWGLASMRAGAPVGKWLLPRGLLREPPSSLARADMIVITRVDQCTAGDLAALEREIAALAPGRPIARAAQRPTTLRDARGEAQALSSIRGRAVDLVSGIGNPAAFERSVSDLGARIESHRIFPDHHAYESSDLSGLGLDGRMLVCTAKDAVKLVPLGASFLALEIELSIESGGAVLEALLDALILGQGSAERAAIHGGLHG